MSINAIREIVSINEHAVLEIGVQLGWYWDKERNLRLCRGYMFSSGSKYYGNKTSAVNLLSTFKDNLLDDSKENKHIVISGYGTGKTHFALVIANYFSRTSDSDEITGIYEALETSTSKEVVANFRKFKETGKLPQLVIRLRGDVFTNLRSGFLKALKEALSENPLSQNYQIPVICTNALNWVKGLDDVQGKKAEEFLINNYKINLLQLQQKLENFEPISDTLTEELFKNLFEVSPNFGAEANLETVIKQVYNDLCSKPEGPFYKIVIIFDELGLYIDNYRADRIKAGGVALQEITNVCDNLRGKICFISFIQTDPVRYTKEYDKDDIDKFLTKIKKENKFLLATNLELVLKSIILKQPLWEQFMEKHYDEVEITSRLSFGILPYYKKEAWEEKLFLENIVKSCYPLHPITTSLICRLDFAQGRSIIGFINEKIKMKLEEPYEIIRECKGLEIEIKVLNPSFNWIYPYEIVDYFEENFKKAKDGKYNELTYALEQVGHNAPEECMQLLQAIFLYYFAKLEKRSIKHEKILEILSGLDNSTTQYYLQELKDIHHVIHQNEARQEYDFYTPGTSILDVYKRLNNEASLDLPLTSIELVKHLERKELKDLFRNLAEEQGLVADEFTSNAKLSSIEYRLEPIIICPNGITEALKQRYDALDKNNTRGFIYYCISESQNEISHAELKAKTLLSQFRSNYEDYPLPILFAFPEKPIEGISDLTLRLAILDSWAPAKIKEYGEGYQKAKEDLKRQINEKLQIYFKKLQFITHQKVLGELSTTEQNKQRSVINKLFDVCFRYRPSLNYSTLKTNSAQGKKYVGLCARFLCNYGRCREDIDLKNCDKTTKTGINNIIKNILQIGPNKWCIMNEDGKIIEPKDSNIKNTWDLLNGKIANGDFIKLFDIYKILQESPFGYDDLTFALFISSWIGFYQNDLDIDSFNGKIDIDKFSESFEGLTIISKIQKENICIKKLDKESFTKEIEQIKIELKRDITDPEDTKKLLIKVDELINDKRRSKEDHNKLVFMKKLKQEKLIQIKEFLLSVNELNEKQKNVSSLLALCEIRKKIIKLSIPENISSYKDTYNTLLGRNTAFIQDQITKELVNLEKIEDYTHFKKNFNDIKTSLKEVDLINLIKDIDMQIEKLDKQYETLLLQKQQEKIFQEINNLPPASYLPLSKVRENINIIDDLIKKINNEDYSKKAHIKREEYIKQLDLFKGEILSIQEEVYTINNMTQWNNIYHKLKEKQKYYENSEYQKTVRDILEELNNKQIELKCKENLDNKKKDLLKEFSSLKKQAIEVTDIFYLYKLYYKLNEIVIPIDLLSGDELIRIEGDKKYVSDKFFNFSNRVLASTKITSVVDYERKIDRIKKMKDTIRPIGSIGNDFIDLLDKSKNKLVEDYNKWQNYQYEERIKSDIQGKINDIEKKSLDSISYCNKAIQKLLDLEIEPVYKLFIKDFDQPITSIRQKIEDKKIGFTRILDTFKQKFEGTNNLESLKKANKELVKEGHVFTGSDSEDEFKSLNQKFEKKIEELSQIQERINNIEKMSLDRISLCDKALNELEKVEEEFINNGSGKQFNEIILKLRQKIENRENCFNKDLETFLKKSKEKNDLKGVKELRKDFLAKKYIFDIPSLHQDVDTLDKILEEKINNLNEIQSSIMEIEQVSLDTVLSCNQVFSKLLAIRAYNSEILNQFEGVINKQEQRINSAKEEFIIMLDNLKKDIENTNELEVLESKQKYLAQKRYIYDNTSYSQEINIMEEHLEQKIKEVSDRKYIANINNTFVSIKDSDKKTKCLHELFLLLSSKEQEAFVDLIKDVDIVGRN